MIFYGENGGGKFPLQKAVSVEIEREIGVPADSMTVKFVGEAIPELWKVTAEHEVQTIFSGIVDEQTMTMYPDRAETTVYTRSPAALVLDSEAQQGEYIDPNIDVMYRVHLAPFGITLKESAENLRMGQLSIPRSCSHYGALRRFCEYFLGTEPRINSLGEFMPNVLSSGDIIKIDKSQCLKISKRIKRYGILSGVYVTSGGKTMLIENESAKARGIVRCKRIDLADSATGTLSDADNAINDSMDAATEVRVRCSGYCDDIIGRRALFDGELYRVSRIYTVYTPREQYTDIVMKSTD